MQRIAGMARDHSIMEAEGIRFRPRTQILIADMLYALIMIAAAIMRFSNLDDILLAPNEAAAALSALQFLQTGPNEVAIDSPAYTTLTSLVMLIFGVSDVTARIIGVLFGLGLVLLPWFIRKRLGLAGVLVAATFFAASPLFTIVSRTTGGDAIALFAVLLLFVSVIRVRDQAGSGWLYSTGVALGLGLTSSPLFYSGLTTLAVGWIIQELVSPEEGQGLKPNRADVIKVSVVGATILIALSTRLFTHVAGLGETAQLLGSWLAQFSLQGDLQTLLGPFFVLGRYEFFLLPLGILAIIWAVWRNHPLGSLFTYWLLATLVLMLLQRGIMNNALFVPLAGYMLLGLFSSQILQREKNHWTWAVAGLLTLVGAIVLVNLARFLRVSLIEQQVANLWIAMMAIAAAILFIYYFWSEQKNFILQGLWLGILTLMIFYQWGTAWNLTHYFANDPREVWVDRATDDDVQQLMRTLEDVSRKVKNSDSDLPIFSAVDSPVLRWYLRDFRWAEFGHTIPFSARFEVIITPAALNEPSLGDDYLGGDFGLHRSKIAEAYSSPTPLLDALRWVLFHETPRGMTEERVILWIRSDVAQNPVD